MIAVQSQRAFTAAIATKSDKAGQELAIPDAVGDPAGSRTARQWSSTSIIISPGSASISAPLQPNLPGSHPAAVTVPTAAPVITCRRDGCDQRRPSCRSAGSGALARDGPAGQSHRLWNVARPPAAGGPRDHRGGRRTPRPLAAALTGARDRAKQEAHRPAIGRAG